MKSSTVLLAAGVVAFMITACQKPNAPSPPSDPDPKAAAQATDPNAPGTTTNFETPAPAAEPARPAGQ